MGRTVSRVADALFSQTQQRVLSLFFSRPAREFSKSEVIELAKIGSGSVQREIERLESVGLLVAREVGRMKMYRANESASIHAEIVALIEKTIGVAAALRQSLEAIASRIDLALLYGSTAKGTDIASSDIDLLVVGDDIPLEELYAILGRVEERLGRRVSPTLYSREEFRRRRDEQQPFLTKVLAGRHVELIGDIDAVGKPR